MPKGQLYRHTERQRVYVEIDRRPHPTQIGEMVVLRLFQHSPYAERNTRYNVSLAQSWTHDIWTVDLDRENCRIQPVREENNHA